MRTSSIGVWPSITTRTKPSARRLALLVASAFVAAGIFWVLFTDFLLYSFATDPRVVTRIETAKGWAFVGMTAIFLYLVTFRGASRSARARDVVSAVVESIADGILLVRRDQTVGYANPAALRLLHCERLEELVGMGAVEFTRRFGISYLDGSLVPPEHLAARRVFDEGGPLNYKAILHPPGGGELIVSITAAAVRERPGEQPELVVSVLHDVTEVENLERVRDQFFAGAAHSLKTPVSIIKTNIQVLSRGQAGLPERAAATLVRQCGRIDRLVQNILVLARVRSRSLQLFMNKLELRQLIAEVASEMSRADGRREIRTEIAASPWVRGDQERLVIALQNLIDIACRTSPKGAQVTVTLGARDGSGEIGIRFQPLPLEERACDRYGDYDDLGISRSVAATIASAHGGCLREDAEGVDTILRLRLPSIEVDHGDG